MYWLPLRAMFTVATAGAAVSSLLFFQRPPPTASVTPKVTEATIYPQPTKHISFNEVFLSVAEQPKPVSTVRVIPIDQGADLPAIITSGKQDAARTPPRTTKPRHHRTRNARTTRSCRYGTKVSTNNGRSWRCRR